MGASSGAGFVAESQQGDVVHRVAAGFVSFDGCEDGLAEPAHRLVVSTGKGLAEATFAEQGFVWTGGFGHTIGE